MHLGFFLDPEVWIGATIKKYFDEIENAIGSWAGYCSRLLITILDCKIKRCPAFAVREVRIRAVVQKQLRGLVMSILNCDKQRRTAINGCMVGVGPLRKQHARRFQSAFACSE